jgi:FkbM family methyltransferase
MGFFDWIRRGVRKRKSAQQAAATIPARPSLEATAPQPAPLDAAELAEIRAELDFLRTRLATYLGDGITLTYLVDETPIFVNANDIGGPFNLINGGRYEEENTQLLLSFLQPDTVFLDIGANIGYFSIIVGRRLGRSGKIYAFEPHPKLYEILIRNRHVNNLSDRLSCVNSAISNHEGAVTLQYPLLHLGGGHIGSVEEIAGHTAISTDTRRLETLLGPNFRCDLVKIDVEGHELRVLEGMRTIVENSPDIKILFEKLVVDSGSENELQTYFGTAGFDLYAVQTDASLMLLEDGALAPWSGYVLAARPGIVNDGLRRARFSVYGAQLWSPAGPVIEPGALCSCRQER